jgi:hypothetical protein
MISTFPRSSARKRTNGIADCQLPNANCLGAMPKRQIGNPQSAIGNTSMHYFLQ